MAGDSSHSVSKSKETRFPDNVDVLLTSNLAVTLFGDLDGEEISAVEIYKSELSQNLVDYFKTNATELGLISVSKLHLDKKSGSPQVVLTSSRQIPADPEILPVHVLLVAIDLRYSWRTPDPSRAKADRETHPFTERLSLPYKTVLDNVLRRFVTWHLVKRYPLIFGKWCQQLDAESVYFREIADSILRIIRRSSNSVFRSSCRRFIEIIRAQRLAAQSSATRSLSAYICSSDDEECVLPDITDKYTLRYALDRVYRDGMSRPQFKGLVSMPRIDRTDDEDLACNHVDHLPEEPSDTLYETFLWDDAFNSSHLANSYTFFEPRSGGENDFSIDVESDRYHQDVMEEDEDCRDGELPSLDLPHEFHLEESSFQPGLRARRDYSTNLFQHLVYAISPLVLDLDDSDDGTKLDSSQATSEDRNVGSKDLIFVSSHNIQEVRPELLMEDGSQAAPTELPSSFLPSIPGSLSNQEGGLMEQLQPNEPWPQTSPAPTTSQDDDLDVFAPEEIAQAIAQEPLNNEDELELGFLSDNTYDDSILSSICNISENNGDSVARLGFLGTHFSHQSTTLNITWPPQAECEHQLRHSLNLDTLEDSDEEMWSAETNGDASCVGEDAFYMMEFDLIAP